MKTRLLIIIAFVVLLFPLNLASGLPLHASCTYHDPRINLFPSKDEFAPDEPITITIDTMHDDLLEIVAQSPQNLEAFTGVIKSDPSGKATISIPTNNEPAKGTWKIFVKSQSTESQEVVFVGVGQRAEPAIIFNPGIPNYAYGQDEPASFFVAGMPDQSLSVKVFDSDGNNMLENTVMSIPSEGRCNYALDVRGFDAGVYTVNISDKQEEASVTFTVGIQPSTTPISIRTPQHSYYAGDAVLIIGNTPPDSDVDIDVYDPTNDLFVHLSLLAHNGQMFTSFHIPEDAKTGTWKIKARSGVNFDTLEFNVTLNPQEDAHTRTPSGSISPDKTVYPTPWEDRSPLQQFKDGIDPKVIYCNDELMLVQKHDGSPACVTYHTGIKLLERGWATCDDEISYGRGHPCGIHSSGIVNFNSEKYTEVSIITIPLGAVIEGNEYWSPDEITVVLGKNNTVTWVNEDDTVHGFNSDKGGENFWTTGIIYPNKESTVVFNQTGIFEYHGEPHPWITGKVTVLEN